MLYICKSIDWYFQGVVFQTQLSKIVLLEGNNRRCLLSPPRQSIGLDLCIRGCGPGILQAVYW